MFQTKVVEKIKTHTLCSVTFLKKLYCLWDNVEKYSRAGQATDDNMARAHYTMANYGYKNTHSGCVTLSAFPLQQWLHEHASKLRYAYIACLVTNMMWCKKHAFYSVPEHGSCHRMPWQMQALYVIKLPCPSTHQNEHEDWRNLLLFANQTANSEPKGKP